MTPEEIIAREEARLGRRLNPAEKATIRAGATSLDDREVRATAAALEAERTRARSAEELRRANDPDIITSALGAIDRGLGVTAPDALVSAGDTTRDAITGGIGGATMGFADELGGAIENPYGALLATGRLLGAPTDTMNEGARAELAEYDIARDRLREVDERAAEASPWAYGAGALGGALLTAPLTPGLAGGNAATMAARGARAAGRLTPALSAAARAERVGRVGRAALTGAGYGALGGAGASSGDDIAEVLGDSARGAGAGAVGGTLLSGAGEGLVALSHAGPAARREAARRMLDVVTGGNATATDRLVRDLGGGDVIEAAAELGRRGYTGLLDTPASIAERSGVGRSAGPHEAEMAGRPVDPERIAEVIEGVRARYPNPEEAASLDSLWKVGRDMRARGGMTGGDDFTVLGDRASPAPDELIRPSDMPRLSSVTDPVVPPPVREGATLPPPGPGRRRFVMADTVVGEGMEPAVRDTIPSELRMPARNPDGSTVRIPNPALEVAGPIRPSTSLSAPPDIAPPSPAITRPRGERPLGAREMVADWGPSGPPRPRTIPYGTSPGPGDVRSGRTPETAMHILDVLDDLSGWRGDEPPELARAARRARRGVRGALDEEMGKALGPEALEAHRAGRADASVDIPVYREASRAAERGGPRLGTSAGVGLGGALTGWASRGGVLGELPAAIGSGVVGTGLVHGARMLGSGRGPGLTSAAARAAAAVADSPAMASAADAVPRLDAAAAPIVGRLAGAAAAEDPLPALRPVRRREPEPDVFTTGPATPEPSRSRLPVLTPVRRRRRSP